MRTSIVASILFLALCTVSSNAANILCLFTSTGKSHIIIHMAIARTLADRGHNVTVVTTLPLKDKNPKYNHIFLPPAEEDYAEYRRLISTAATGTGWWDSIFRLFWANVERVKMQDKAIKSARFQELMNNPGNQFDAVILGLVFNTYQVGVAAHFKCPVIMSWINQPSHFLLELVGSPLAISSSPYLFSKSPDIIYFKKRLANIWNYAIYSVFERFGEYKSKQYYDDHFSAERYPSYDDMMKNVSLLFCASHFSEGTIRPLTPAFVEIGGIQVKEKPDPLPKDIEEFLRTANEGFILFSLGTNIKSTDLSSNATSAMFKVLSQSKYKVLWKWDGTDPPGKSSNIMFRNWFPQDDLLAHSKLKLFITHAGKGSTTEAQYHGVPMLAIPIYGDQFEITEGIVKLGYGLMVNHRNVTEKSFHKAFYDVLGNPRYLGAISRFSRLYRDRPLSARESVIFWTEYVIRHHGAKHMQSPVVHMNFFQKNSLDVIGFLGLVLCLIYFVIKGLFRFLCMCVLIFKRKLKLD